MPRTNAFDNDLLRGYAKLAVHKVGLVSAQLEVTSECFQACWGCDSWRDDASGAVK